MNFRKFILTFLTVRVLVLLVAAALPLTGPHEWRQFDTLGMSYRYFIEIFQSQVDKYPFFIPAVLQAGDQLGITPVELPIINFLLAPLFVFGNFLGQFFVSIALLIVNLQLFYRNYKLWKDEEILGEKIGEAFLLFPLISFSLLYFAKFMPDILSVQLVLAALGMGIIRKKMGLAFFMASIGLMIKPTSVIVFALFLITSRWKDYKQYIWIAFSILLTIIYYKLINPYILELSGQKSIFAVGTKPLLVAIQQILSDPKLFVTIFVKNLFGDYIFIPVLIGCLAIKFYYKKSISFIAPLSGIIFLQWLFLHLLSGNHPYWHNYYYIGIVPIASILLLRVIKLLPKNIASAFLIIILSLSLLESVYNLKPIFKPQKKMGWKIRTQCEELIEKTPELPWKKGYHFRSHSEQFPVLGMCFGEIQNAKKTEYGFFYKLKKIPAECAETLAESQDLIIAKCI